MARGCMKSPRPDTGFVTVARSYLRLGFPALDAVPNGAAAGIGGTLLLSALGFFFSRLPLGMEAPLTPTVSRQQTLGAIGAEVRS